MYCVSAGVICNIEMTTWMQKQSLSSLIPLLDNAKSFFAIIEGGYPHSEIQIHNDNQDPIISGP